MSIRFTCPRCKTAYTADAHDAGKKSLCQECGRRLQVPSRGTEGDSPPPVPASAQRLIETQPATNLPARRRANPGQLTIFIIAVVAAVGVAGTVVAVAISRGKPHPRIDTETRGPSKPSDSVANNITAWRPSGNANEKQTVSDTPLKGENLFPRLVRCAALVLTPQNSEGTGFVVDTANRLIVTNYHVVGRENKVIVLFPLYEKSGELVTDTRIYLSKPREVGVQGEVIDRDPKRDLALIRVEKIPLRTSAIPLARKQAATGSVVYSVGGSGADDNLLWRLTKGSVRGRLRRNEQLEHGHLDCMILETDAPINPGDSGGPVINESENWSGQYLISINVSGR